MLHITLNLFLLFPVEKSITVQGQQDNPGFHVKEYNADIMETGPEGSWDIQMMSHPI
jgi:hypothetical protein